MLLNDVLLTLICRRGLKLLLQQVLEKWLSLLQLLNPSQCRILIVASRKVFYVTVMSLLLLGSSQFLLEGMSSIQHLPFVDIFRFHLAIG